MFTEGTLLMSNPGILIIIMYKVIIWTLQVILDLSLLDYVIWKMLWRGTLLYYNIIFLCEMWAIIHYTNIYKL